MKKTIYYLICTAPILLVPAMVFADVIFPGNGQSGNEHFIYINHTVFLPSIIGVLIGLAITILIEYFIYFLFLNKEISIKKLLYFSIIINFITLPLANAFVQTLFFWFGGPFLFLFVVAGLIVVFLESFLIKILTKIKYSLSLIISLMANIVTALIGMFYSLFWISFFIGEYRPGDTDLPLQLPNWITWLFFVAIPLIGLGLLANTLLKNKKKSIFLFILNILIVVGIIIGGYFYINYNNSRTDIIDISKPTI